MFRKIIKGIAVLSVVLFSYLIIINSEVCRSSAFAGLVICGRVIIPSLYPFTVCVVFITRSGVLQKLKFLNFLTTKLLGLSSYETGIVILSSIGGYPVGVKILDSAVENGELSSKRAGEMLPFCVNAGPAFIVSAIGSGILGSTKLGYILLLCHFLGSVFLLIIFRRKSEDKNVAQKIKKVGLAENFVLSATDAAGSVITISTFVILFSVIIGYLKFYSNKLKWLSAIALLTEVTNAMTMTRNVYLISFLLGFSGICVWCQIFSVANNFKVNYFKFILSRILHGLLSAGFLYVILKVFKVYVATGNFQVQYIYSTPALTVSMVLMCIVFAISVLGKNFSGKIVEDIV